MIDKYIVRYARNDRWNFIASPDLNDVALVPEGADATIHAVALERADALKRVGFQQVKVATVEQTIAAYNEAGYDTD